MYPVSDRFPATIAGTYTNAARVDVLRGGELVAPVQPVDGEVDVDLNATTCRSCKLTVVDSSGVLVPKGATDPLMPFGAEVRVWRGVAYSDGTSELLPLGTFRLRTADVVAGGGVQVQLTGYDRSSIVQGPAAAPIPIQAGTKVEQAVAQVIAAKYPAATFDLAVTGYTTPALLVHAGDDVWGAATKLAQSAGYRLFADRMGVFTMRPIVASPQPAAVFVDGDGSTFWAPQRSFDGTGSGTGLVNEVIVQGTHSSTGGTVSGSAADMNPLSPTYINGPYGKFTQTVQSEVVATSGQATAMAQGLLAQQLGVTEQVRLTCLPDPSLDEGDVVTLTSTPLGLAGVRQVVAQLTVPLLGSGSMALTAAKTLLAATAVPLLGTPNLSDVLGA